MKDLLTVLANGWWVYWRCAERSDTGFSDAGWRTGFPGAG